MPETLELIGHIIIAGSNNWQIYRQYIHTCLTVLPVNNRRQILLHLRPPNASYLLPVEHLAILPLLQSSLHFPLAPFNYSKGTLSDWSSVFFGGESWKTEALLH